MATPFPTDCKEFALGNNERAGIVVRAAEDSFAGMEEAAHLAMAKGVFWERGAFPQEPELSLWLGEQEETHHFAIEQLLVAPPRETICGGDGGNGKETGRKKAVAGPEEIREACARLVAGLPQGCCEGVRRDAEALAEMMVRLCPEVPWLILRLEVIQNNACWRWHQDWYTGRAIVTYVGPGTWAVDDAAVRFDRLNAGATDGLVPDTESVYRMTPNSVLLIKGNTWPGISGLGLTHKSPDLRTNNGGRPPPKRLVLKADLADDRVFD